MGGFHFRLFFTVTIFDVVSPSLGVTRGLCSSRQISHRVVTGDPGPGARSQQVASMVAKEIVVSTSRLKTLKLRRSEASLLDDVQSFQRPSECQLPFAKTDMFFCLMMFDASIDAWVIIVYKKGCKN